VVLDVADVGGGEARKVTDFPGGVDDMIWTPDGKGFVFAARTYLDLGLHISVAGIVTFKAAEAVRDAVRRIPRERLLVETDSPFLAPVPFRGKRNEPAHVVHVASKVAELWGVSPGEVAEITTGNAKRLFRLP